MHHMLRFFVGAVAILTVWCSLVWAQDAEPNYGDWRRVAERAAEAIENDRASEAAMEELRDQLVDWRGLFETEASRSPVAVTTLEAQLKQLGAVPESGEPEDVAEERRALELALSEARAPTRRAELARTEAAELIRSLDQLTIDRQTRQILQPGPLPFKPSLWSTAPKEIGDTLRLISLEFQTGWVHEIQQQELRKSVPVVLFYLFVAYILLTRGMRWTDNALNRLAAEREYLSASRWIAIFLLSYGQVILPMFGVYALSLAISSSELTGLRGDQVLSVLPIVTFEILTARWLGERVFSRSSQPLVVVNLSEKEKRSGRRAAQALGWILAISTFLFALAHYESWSLGTEAILYFILTSFAAFYLWRMSRLVAIHARTMTRPEGEGLTAIGQMILMLSRFMLLVSIVGVGLSVFGLTRAGGYLVFSSIRTAFLAAFLMVLQRLVQKIFAALSKTDDEDSSLGAVLTGVGLVILALPIFAMCWGAQLTNLEAVWDLISKGISLGDLAISPTTVLLFVIAYVIGHAITRLMQAFLRDNVLPKTNLDQGGQTAVASGAGYVGIFLSAVVAFSVAGINLSNVALLAGALSVGIGFGLQNIVSNFVSGIILLIERPVSEGDWIDVGGKMGYVRDISVRSTRIETFDRTDVVIPNSDLVSGTVTNYTRGNTVGRVIVSVGVAYGTDTRRVEAILREIAESHPMVLANPAPSVVFQGFGADSLDFEIRAILRDVNWMLTVKSDLNHEIARRFSEENIEIPFAQRDIWLRNPEALRGEAVANSPAAPTTQPSFSKTPTPPDMEDMDGSDGDGDGR